MKKKPTKKQKAIKKAASKDIQSDLSDAEYEKLVDWMKEQQDWLEEYQRGLWEEYNRKANEKLLKELLGIKE